MIIHPNHDRELYAAAKLAQAPKIMLALILATPRGQALDGTVATVPVPVARRLRQPRHDPITYRTRDLPPVSNASGRPAQARKITSKRAADTREPGTRNDTRTVTVRTVAPSPVDPARAAGLKRAETLARRGRPGNLGASSLKPSEITRAARDWTARVDVTGTATVHAVPRTHAEIVAAGILSE